jgi:hypothetical protein
MKVRVKAFEHATNLDNQIVMTIKRKNSSITGYHAHNRPGQRSITDFFPPIT